LSEVEQSAAGLHVVGKHKPCALPSVLARKVRSQDHMSSNLITSRLHHNTYPYEVSSISDQ